jgi:hypothetical protein
VPCPNPVLAHALVAPTRTLGATARVLVQQIVEHTVITTPTDVDAVLTAAGGTPATAAWRLLPPPGNATHPAKAGSGKPLVSTPTTVPMTAPPPQPSSPRSPHCSRATAPTASPDTSARPDSYAWPTRSCPSPNSAPSPTHR